MQLFLPAVQFIVLLKQAGKRLFWFCSIFSDMFVNTFRISYMYLQLQGGRGLWHCVVNKSVAEGHKLVADDLDGLLSSRSYRDVEKEKDLWASCWEDILCISEGMLKYYLPKMQQLCVALLHRIDSCRLWKVEKNDLAPSLTITPTSKPCRDHDLQLMNVIVFDVDVEAVLLQ